MNEDNYINEYIYSSWINWYKKNIQGYGDYNNLIRIYYESILIITIYIIW
jgi:hypothetical protein